ncbi:MAG: glycosyltransferase, partial [Patescibacteria group bacterium]
MKTKISIVSAAYNEEDNISTLIREIKGVFRNLENYEYEIILVDDGSTDKTWAKIRNAAEK